MKRSRKVHTVPYQVEHKYNSDSKVSKSDPIGKMGLVVQVF